MMKTTLALVSLSLFACGKSDKKAAPAVQIDVAGVNALVPATFKDKVVFDKKEVVEERGKRSKTTYTLAAPKDWEPGDMKMFAKLRPKTGWGNFTEVTLGSNCDGECSPKDWAATSEKVNFKQFREGDWKILKEESSKTNHLVIAQSDKRVLVSYAWWTDGASKYNTCTADLDPSFGDDAAPPMADLAPAFAKACQAVSVSD
jgi:hypothetical protein